MLRAALVTSALCCGCFCCCSNSVSPTVALAVHVFVTNPHVFGLGNEALARPGSLSQADRDLWAPFLAAVHEGLAVCPVVTREVRHQYAPLPPGPFGHLPPTPSALFHVGPELWLSTGLPPA